MASGAEDMRGVVVLCFIFLVVPGQGAAQDASSSTVHPNTDPATAIPGAPINVTPAANTTTMNVNATMAPNDTGNANVTTAPSTTVNVNATTAPNTTVNVNTTTAPNTTVNVNATMAPNTTENANATMAPNTTENANATMAPENGTTAGPKPGTSEKPKPSTPEPLSCASGPCGNGSTCLQLYQTYECRCPLNYHYDAPSRSCTGAGSFFGEFVINGVNFDSNPESPEYTGLYNKVINQSRTSLSHLSGYQTTVIIQISFTPSTSAARSSRSSGTAAARVSHLFLQGAPTSAAQVTAAIKANPGDFTDYSGKGICDGFYCDAETTDCAATADGQGATCSCKTGKYSSSASDSTVTSCRDCSPDCYTTQNKYCNVKSPTAPQCECGPGYKSNGDRCQECDFGYSGVNCADDSLLILVIVGAVLGAAVVALLGAVIGVSVSAKKAKKQEDRTALIKKEPAQGEGSPAPVRIFPKVQVKTDLGAVNKAANVYEDEEHNHNFPKRDYDENPWYEMSRKDRNY